MKRSRSGKDVAKLLATAGPVRGVSERTVFEIVEELAKEGFLTCDLCSSQQLSRTWLSQQEAFRHRELTTVRLAMKGGGFFDWAVWKPEQLLKSYSQAPALQSLLRRLHPGHAQTLLLYADEVTPGSLLQPDVQRKTVAFNMSIANLLPIDSPYIWMPLTVMRSATMKDVEGGMSQCIAALLRLLQPLFEAGATLDLAEGCPRLLIFDDIRYIMDEQAIQFCFYKGRQWSQAVSSLPQLRGKELSCIDYIRVLFVSGSRVLSRLRRDSGPRSV